MGRYLCSQWQRYRLIAFRGSSCRNQFVKLLMGRARFNYLNNGGHTDTLHGQYSTMTWCHDGSMEFFYLFVSVLGRTGCGQRAPCRRCLWSLNGHAASMVFFGGVRVWRQCYGKLSNQLGGQLKRAPRLIPYADCSCIRNSVEICLACILFKRII